MKTIKLLGSLGNRFGETWKARSKTLGDIFRLIDCQVDGFRTYLIECQEKGLSIEARSEDEIFTESDLGRTVSSDTIYVSVVPSGSKGGAGRLLAAAAILTILVATGGTAGASMAGMQAFTATGINMVATSIAINLAMTGLTELLAPGPETEEQDDSYLFNGPVNVARQGLPVPVCYGELVVGGAPISTSFRTRPFKSASYTYQIPEFNVIPRFNYSISYANISVPTLNSGALYTVDDQEVQFWV